MTRNDQTGTATGGCSCGAVTFKVTLPSRFCAHCHCGTCRRAHGAAFVTWVGFVSEQFRLTSGDDTLVRHVTETGATRSFCGTCGSTLLYEGPRWPGEVHVARANIDGQIDRAPGGHSYVDHAASWWSIEDSLPQYGGPDGGQPKSK